MFWTRVTVTLFTSRLSLAVGLSEVRQHCLHHRHTRLGVFDILQSVKGFMCALLPESK